MKRLALLLIVGLLFVGCSQIPDKPKSPVYKPGDIAYFGSDTGQFFLANDEESLIRLLEAVRAKSESLMYNLALEGKAFGINRKTKIRVIKFGELPNVLEIEILDGNYKGRLGWTTQEFIKRD